MKKEQERRITEDKKDSVHEQLLHTVSCQVIQKWATYSIHHCKLSWYIVSAC